MSGDLLTRTFHMSAAICRIRVLLGDCILVPLPTRIEDPLPSSIFGSKHSRCLNFPTIRKLLNCARWRNCANDSTSWESTCQSTMRFSLPRLGHRWPRQSTSAGFEWAIAGASTRWKVGTRIPMAAPASTPSAAGDASVKVVQN